MNHDVMFKHAMLVSSEREQTALGFVYMAHEGQKDKTGHPYQEHLYRVAQLVPDHLKLSAYAHDVLEDTTTVEADLYNVGFNPWEVNLVKLLTHYPNERMSDYLLDVCSDSEAKRIKIADITDNLSRNRMEGLDEATQERLKSKYYKALCFLADVG